MVEYVSLASSEGEGHFIRSELAGLLDSEAIVFDLDGTLVDSRMSLDESMLASVKTIFAAMSGRIVSRERLENASFDLRKTGGFNNPLDVAFSLTLALATSLDDSCISNLAELMDQGPVGIADIMSKRVGDCSPRDLETCMAEVIQYADERGVQSINEGIDRLYGGKKKREAMQKLREALKYPGGAHESIIPAIFDSFFLGGRKYRDVHGSNPPLEFNVGLSNNEREIMKPDTANFLRRRFPGGVGLATGRPKYAADKVLPKYISELLAEGAATYFDDVLEEGKRRAVAGDSTYPGKPDPFSLKHAAEGLKPGRGLIYVGDSTEDMLMARRMEGYGKDVHFIGVYRYNMEPRVMENIFIEMGASAVLPTVNQLRDVLS